MISIKDMLFKALFRSKYYEIKRLRVRVNTLECENARQVNIINRDLNRQIENLSKANKSLQEMVENARIA